MLLRPPFFIAAVLIFSVLNGWALITGLKQNNGWSSTLALMAIGGTFYFIHMYQKLLNTPPDEVENEFPKTQE